MLAVAMKIHLPRPYDATRRLTFYEGLALDALRAAAGPSGIGYTSALSPVDLLNLRLETSPQKSLELLKALERRRIILLTDSHFAILSQLSAALKNERDRNRKRLTVAPDWTLHHRARQLFTFLRARIDRPASYTLPAAFAPILSRHEHHHKTKCPPDVELLTEACYAGELSTVLTLIEEQRSANREPVLLYTRKAIYLGIRRHAKR